VRILFLSDVYFPRINGVSTSIQTFRRELAAIGLVGPKISPVAEHAGPAWRALRGRGVAGADLNDALIGAVVAVRRDTAS
jgi:predicted nucleic acid-binding protein